MDPFAQPSDAAAAPGDSQAPAPAPVAFGAITQPGIGAATLPGQPPAQQHHVAPLPAGAAVAQAKNADTLEATSAGDVQLPAPPLALPHQQPGLPEQQQERASQPAVEARKDGGGGGGKVGAKRKQQAGRVWRPIDRAVNARK